MSTFQNKILNNTMERSKIIYPFVFWDDAYSNEELENIKQHCKNYELINGKVGGAENEIEHTEIRQSQVCFVSPNIDNQWFFDKTNALIETMNTRFYNFDLNGYDSFQYTEYNGTKKGKYDFHMDIGLGQGIQKNEEMRKLSFVLFLSDPSEYEGGNFFIMSGNPNNLLELEQKKGRMVAFPSFMMHRVSEVTSGIRNSIVIWATGPKFK